MQIVNVELLKNPFNWIIVLLILYVGIILLDVITQRSEDV